MVYYNICQAPMLVMFNVVLYDCKNYLQKNKYSKIEQNV